jgi:hypothetical protein
MSTGAKEKKSSPILKTAGNVLLWIVLGLVVLGAVYGTLTAIWELLAGKHNEEIKTVAQPTQEFLVRWAPLISIGSVLIFTAVVGLLLLNISDRLKEIADRFEKSQAYRSREATKTDERLDRLAELVEKHIRGGS